MGNDEDGCRSCQMTPNRTELAFLARGIDSDTARKLREKGFTLDKLRSASLAKLKSLRLNKSAISALRKSGRASIPMNSLVSVIFANRSLCCVCRDPNRPVIVHHITPWAKSRDHSPSNLAVICTPHHGEAHTVRGLEFTLSAQRLRKLKAEWESAVKKLDPLAIRSASQLQSDLWYYFNHTRLFELAQTAGIDFNDLDGFRQAVAMKLCDIDGRNIRPARIQNYMYEGGFGIQRYRYMKSVMHALLEHTRITNISDLLDRGTLSTLVGPGDLVFVQGAHYFKRVDSGRRIAKQTHGRRSANRVEIKFVFDRSEATSMSAWSLWLSGRQNVGSVLLVKSLAKSKDKLQILGTIIGIRAATNELKKRSYEIGLYKSGIPQRRELASEEEFIAIS